MRRALLLSPRYSLSSPKPNFSLSKLFSTTPTNDESDLAQSLSKELLKKSNSEPLSLPQRLDLGFSHITPSQTLIKSVLDISPDAGRNVLGFQNWVFQNPNFTPDDATFANFIDYFGRRRDFKAFDDVLGSGREIVGPKTMESTVDRLCRGGRPGQAVSFFENMEKDYGFVRNKESLKIVVEKLCENGFGKDAEKLVKSVAGEIFPDEEICDLLIKGWCVNGKLDEAKRLAEEMYRGGFEIGTNAYNAVLDCVCKLCRKKDPFRMQSEVDKVLIDMDVAGVPRNVETFNVLINNLCKIRRTEDAMQLFFTMQWGSSPNSETFLLLINSLYQAARVYEGDQMIDRMKSAGFEKDLGIKQHYGFLKILCGIERIDHAMSLFDKMKKDGIKPGIKTYDLLMGKLVAHGRVDKANSLFKEASSNGVEVTPKAYKLDPRFVKQKPKAVKKEKKRLTLPEKMAKKKTKLRKLRLSFVKKPKKAMRRMV